MALSTWSALIPDSIMIDLISSTCLPSATVIFGGAMGLMSASTAASELIFFRIVQVPAWIVASRRSTSSRKGSEFMITPSSTSWLATVRAEDPGAISIDTSSVPCPS